MKLKRIFIHQQGASLVIGMIILLAISLLTMLGARAGLSQYKSLQASLDYQQTFLAADSALGTSSRWLLNNIKTTDCISSCPPITLVQNIDSMPNLLAKNSLWWQQNGQSWQGGRRLLYLESSERLLLWDVLNNVWDEYQREVYSSYFYQLGTLPGNRVLLHELWLVDRPYSSNQQPLLADCLSSTNLRTALTADQLGICGRLGWEQQLP
ncbi:MAG: hypothetical protein L3J22_09845 [Xanthomonadales bacterium]|nr:hypothetical protein [Xanthomonadales bacterium]